MITIIPISAEYTVYAQSIADELIANGCAAVMDTDFLSSLNHRCTSAQNYILTIGHLESMSNSITFRDKSRNAVRSDVSRTEFLGNWRTYVH